MNLVATIVYLLAFIIQYNGYLGIHGSYSCCDAKKIDSYDLLIGDWDTSVRLQHPTKLREIFSTTTVPSTPGSTTQSTAIQPIIGWLNPLKRHRRSRTIPCRLSLYANGTFGLTDRRPEQVPKLQSPEPLSSNTFIIRGKWSLQTNPYCVTDRFYDDILLESFPRIQKERQQMVLPHGTTHQYNNNGATTSISTRATTYQSVTTITRPIQKVQLKLRCRLSGHFTGGNGRRLGLPFRVGQRRRYYACGTITHGVMLLEQIDHVHDCDAAAADDDITTAVMRAPFRFVRQKYQRLNHPRQIIASFSAQRIISTYSDLASQSNDFDDELDM